MRKDSFFLSEKLYFITFFEKYLKYIKNTEIQMFLNINFFFHIKLINEKQHTILFFQITPIYKNLNISSPFPLILLSIYLYIYKYMYIYMGLILINKT